MTFRHGAAPFEAVPVETDRLSERTRFDQVLDTLIVMAFLLVLAGALTGFLMLAVAFGGWLAVAGVLLVWIGAAGWILRGCGL